MVVSATSSLHSASRDVDSPMTTTMSGAATRRAVWYTIALAGLWILVAAWRPEVTYHLAPLLVAAIPPIAVTVGEDPESRLPMILRAGVAGLMLSLAATAILSWLGWLSGPSLLPAGGAAAEAVVFAFVGAAVGAATAVVRTRR